MRVQRVLAPDSGAESWTLLGSDLRPVAPAESVLRGDRTGCHRGTARRASSTFGTVPDT